MTDPHGADSAEIERLAHIIAGVIDGGLPDKMERRIAQAVLAALRTPPDDAVKLREALERISSGQTMVLVSGKEMVGMPLRGQDAQLIARAALKGTPNNDA